MIIPLFQINDKDKKYHFFEKIFLLVEISIDVTFRVSFLILSNVEINFNNQKLECKFYTVAKVFSTIKKLELVGTKEFVIAALDPEDKIFVIQIISLAIFDMNKVHLSRMAQIFSLKVNMAPTMIFAEYFNFAGVFLLNW